MEAEIEDLYEKRQKIFFRLKDAEVYGHKI